MKDIFKSIVGRRRHLAYCALISYCSVLLCWWYQANYAQDVSIIHIPRWIAGSTNVSYSIAIGRSQVKPYGTIWKTKTYRNMVISFPMYDWRDKPE